jgi:ABC-type antimicrobial peptide transport system permease subunit
VWRQAGPPVPHQVRSATSQLAAVYAQEAQLTALLGLVALLAVAVALAGAYALVADTLRRRRTELVLRRLHGAGPAAMARAVLAECVWPAGIAALVALPLAAAGGALYLEGFEDRIDLAAGVAVPMLLALGATTLVTGLALARHLRQALKLQPIEALR